MRCEIKGERKSKVRRYRGTMMEKRVFRDLGFK